MKKLLFLLIVVVGMSSCYQDLTNNVEDSEAFTTLKMQQLQKDTVAISIDEENLYIFDEENRVVIRMKEPSDKAISTSGTYLFIIHCILLVCLVGWITNN